MNGKTIKIILRQYILFLIGLFLICLYDLHSSHCSFLVDLVIDNKNGKYKISVWFFENRDEEWLNRYVKHFEEDDRILRNTYFVVRIDGKGFHK